MIIRSFKVANYRNIENLLFEPSPEINIFYGANGSGKTNLLESIFTLCLGRSQKGAIDSVVMRSGEEYFRLEGQIENNQRTRKVSIAFESGGKKKIQIDGVACKLSELFQNFCVVATGPEDNRIIAGSPSARRLFLDMYLSQISANYLDNLSKYQKALAQKNAALKRRMDPEMFDELMITYGCRVITARNQFINKLSKYAVNCYYNIAGGEKLGIIYQPSIPMENSEQNSEPEHSIMEESFRRALFEKRQREEILRVSIVGPHRDDIAFSICDFPARTHGSQGQWRTAAIALKLGVYQLLKEERGQPPILLLDEIFAELDSRRAVQLMHMFGDFSQMFITMAMQPPAGMREEARTYRVTDGHIQEIV